MKTLSLSALVVGLVSGCGSPWTAVKQPATPSRIARAKTFSVKPLDFSGVSIDGAPEAAWRAAHGEAKSKWWDKDKAIASRSFLRMLTSNTQSGCTFVEAGNDAEAPLVVVRIGDIHDAEYPLTLQITTATGEVIEEATMTMTIRGYGVSEQLRGSGKRFADAVATYIAKRRTT
jgi:hypothetical protein